MICLLAMEGGQCMHSCAIHPMLRGLVIRTVGFEEFACAGLVHRELPFAGLPLILVFGAPYLLSEASDSDQPLVSRRSFVAGLHETRTTSKTTGATWGVQIDLTPIGAYRILGLPLGDLANLVVDATEVFGDVIFQLEQQLFDARSWADRFDLIDAFLIERLLSGPRESTEIAWVWHQLRSTHGGVPIALLADELGWSRKRLIGACRDQLGLPPKMLGRVLRFQRLLALNGNADAASWSDLAIRSGYCDQAHLVREFRAFTGITPGMYRRDAASSGGTGGAAAVVG